MPACAELSNSTDLGGSGSGLSPQFQGIFGRVERNGMDNSSNICYTDMRIADKENFFQNSVQKNRRFIV